MAQPTLITVDAQRQNRLALGIFAAYLRLHPEATLTDLRRLFPKREINPNAGVDEIFVPVDRVSAHQSETWNGYFVSPAEVLTLGDGTQIAVTNMWPIDALQRLIKAVAPFGIDAKLASGPFASPGYQLNCLAPATSPLVAEVAADVEAFLKQLNQQQSTPDQRNLFFGEDDLKMHLAVWLQTRRQADGQTPRYDDVETEYLVPISELPNFPWQNNDVIKLDLVVRRGEQYVPIELKYMLKEIRLPLTRFGEKLNGLHLVKSQGAQNDKSYAIWRDVKRIEALKHRFAKGVPGGIVLVLTNDGSYLNAPRKGSDYALFSTASATHSRIKHWAKEPMGDKAKKHPNFEVDREYTITWHDVKLENQPFHYFMLTV